LKTNASTKLFCRRDQRVQLCFHTETQPQEMHTLRVCPNLSAPWYWGEWIFPMPLALISTNNCTSAEECKINIGIPNVMNNFRIHSTWITIPRKVRFVAVQSL
jgi:hypothetical protein